VTPKARFRLAYRSARQCDLYPERRSKHWLQIERLVYGAAGATLGRRLDRPDHPLVIDEREPFESIQRVHAQVKGLAVERRRYLSTEWRTTGEAAATLRRLESDTDYAWQAIAFFRKKRGEDDLWELLCRAKNRRLALAAFRELQAGDIGGRAVIAVQIRGNSNHGVSVEHALALADTLLAG
jgi:hypothetical protein